MHWVATEGELAASEEQVAAAADIVVPVHNALSLARRCIESVLADKRRPPFVLWLVDDCSDSETAARLREFACRDASVRVVRTARNIGFLGSCNYGIGLGTAPFVVLLNSDVVVVEGWLERLLACAATDASIASVNPLTNKASQIEIPIPPGANFLGVDRMLARRRPEYPDVVTGVGFCMLLRRRALEQVGTFDEAFGHGYCEESDLCMRLTTAGWRTVVSDDCYVYHRGGGSFRDRAERYLRNRQLFDQRWSRVYRKQFRAFARRRPLAPVRAELAGQEVWDPMPVVWETARSARAAVGRGEPAAALRALARGALQVPRARRQRATRESVERFGRPGALRVTYLLHRTVVAGGVLSVIQLVNELVLLGIDARIATLFLDPSVRRWTPLLAEPLVYRTADEMVGSLPDTDLVIATHWTTADWANRLVADQRAAIPLYFVQDYEPWFLDDEAGQQRVAATYGQFEHLVAKSDWLCSLLRDLGRKPVKIPLGMDLSTYYKRDVERKPNRVVAMARPATPRRGFGTLVAALSELRQSHPSAEIVLFGDARLDPASLGLEARNLGVISDQESLAELYSSAAVFVDSSHFQGFGRCALEAMACGAAAVVTDVGGVGEYARNGKTALTVPPRNPQRLAEAVGRLLDDERLRNSLAAAGAEEARRFCHLEEARRTAELFHALSACQA